MVQWAFKIYAVISILAPWIFLGAKIFNLYNYPSKNTLIFIGLFVYSGIVILISAANLNAKTSTRSN